MSHGQEARRQPDHPGRRQYPIYRLEWQGLGSQQRRMWACMTGVGAEPFDFGSGEFVALEAYLAARGAGLPRETPGVLP